MRGLNWVIALVGILTIIDPFVFGFTSMTAGFWSNIIVGILLLVLGVIAALTNNLRTDQTLDWINAILGLWLLISPFVLGMTSLPAALWSDVVLGIIALILGVWSAVSEGRVVA